MAGRRTPDVEVEVEGVVEDTAPEVEVEAEVEGEQPTEDVEAESDEGAERTAAAHVAFMDGHELVRFAPGDTIPSKYADRVTSAKAVSE